MTTKSQYDFSLTNILNYQILINQSLLLNYYNKYKPMLSRKKTLAEQAQKLQKELTKQQMDELYQNIKQHSIPYLISMIANKTNQIQSLFFNLERITSVVSWGQQQQQILQIAGKIVNVANQMLPTFNILQSESHEYYKRVIDKLPQIQVNSKQFNKPSEEFVSIFLFVAQTIVYRKCKAEQITLKQMITRFKQYQLKQTSHIKNCSKYEQIAMNWIKRQLNSFQNQKYCMCCKLTFYEGQKIYNQYIKHSVFENRGVIKMCQKQKKMEMQKLQLARYICSFLNCEGGVILMAFEFRNTDVVNELSFVKGTPLQINQKSTILNYIKSCADDFIQPKHKQFQKSQVKIKFEQRLLHSIYYYLNVEFVPVINSQTLQYQKSQKGTIINYVCKLYIRMGHPRYFYYAMENDKAQSNYKYPIRFYNRSDNIKQANTSLDKGRTIQTAYEDIYKKLLEYEKNISENYVPERKQIHNNCALDNTMSWQVYNLNIKTNDDD